jgi:ADP-ribose pyrophosphatase YjhB (NUDIX family)
MEDMNSFNVILLGIIYDPKNKKILIGKREKDPYVPELKWTPPGGRIIPGKDLEDSLKIKIKEQTGFEIENLGNIFAMVPKEKKVTSLSPTILI